MRGFLVGGFALMAFAAVLALGAIGLGEDEPAVLAIVVSAVGLAAVFVGLFGTRASQQSPDQASGVRSP